MRKFSFSLILILIVTLFNSTKAGENDDMNKNAKRITRIYVQHLTGTSEEVFPLLCPVREYKWIERWKCDMVFSESGVAEKDCIFKTSFPDDGPEKTWIVTNYIPNEEIEFIITNTNLVIRYRITLIHGNHGDTVSEWKQIITALNEEGEKSIEKMTEEAYTEQIKNIEEMLNYFLTTKTMKKEK